MADNMSLTGLSDEEAKEFHSIFMQSFLIFTAVAVVAHFLAWAWRPWIPGAEGYGSVIEGVHNVTAAVSQIAPLAG
ncbi:MULTISPECIES: light-harvesting antenna LH1, beta subunit [Halorhodospira]|nr:MULTISPECIES: light-harvesting antenna LH1, beta subunit [Halorhodospira]ABM62178.1 antenna complex, alpha/beta subunit [Halorhodospira halophila SL1]MBK1729506.1 light-harvesting protein [Halorhodospira halophila]MBK5936986.1 light-harvesting protein [Halorhodospira halophila]MBK5943730.1 light-harvesting protein [Halorhodospira halophila]MCC3749947.1 light-harvesting protein [Halorhodospira halophila]